MEDGVVPQNLPIKVEQVQVWRGTPLGLTEQLYHISHSRASGSMSQSEERMGHRNWDGMWNRRVSLTI